MSFCSAAVSDQSQVVLVLITILQKEGGWIFIMLLFVFQNITFLIPGFYKYMDRADDSSLPLPSLEDSADAENVSSSDDFKGAQVDDCNTVGTGEGTFTVERDLYMECS